MKSWAPNRTLAAAMIAAFVVSCSKSSPNAENGIRGSEVSAKGVRQETPVAPEAPNETAVGARTISEHGNQPEAAAIQPNETAASTRNVSGLAAQLASADFNTRFSAGQELFKLGSNAAPAIATIVRLLEAEPDKVHDVMLRVVEHCPSEAQQIEPTLQKYLTSSNVSLRISCARTLWVLDHSYAAQVRPVAIRSLGEADAGIRIEAASLLWSTDQDAKEVVPTLTALLNDPTTAYDYRTIRLLGQIGPSAKEAIPALHDWLNSRRARDNFVTNAAVAALQKMELTP